MNARRQVKLSTDTTSCIPMVCIFDEADLNVTSATRDVGKT